MKHEPAAADKAHRHLQIYNAILWIAAGLTAFVAPTLTSSPEKGRLIYMMLFILFWSGSARMLAAARGTK
jgi:uncharacterized membrane protein